MTDFASALRNRLVGDPDVAAVTVRVHWNIVPQDAPLPYIRLQVISDSRPEHLKGYSAERQTRVQADCYAQRYGTARQLAEKVISALATGDTVDGIKFGRTAAEGPRDLGEELPGGIYAHRMSLDLLVQHRLA